MYSRQEKLFFKLTYILHHIVLSRLREVFKEEWDKRFPQTPWMDDQTSLQMFRNTEQRGPNWRTNKSRIPKSGDRKQWDMTALFFMTLYTHAINLPKTSSFYTHIDHLRQIRNKFFGHHPKAEISELNFEQVYQDIKTCLLGLKCTSAMMQELYDIKNEITVVNELIRKETCNQSLLTIIVILIASVVVFVVPFICVYSPLFRELQGGHKCQSTYFPESRKPSYFVGREREISTVTNLLANGQHRIVNIVGPPAFGKTATAVAIGQRLRKEYNFRVAFVGLAELNMTSKSKGSKDILNDILVSLNGVPKASITLRDFRTQIGRLTTRKTLLILDNVETILRSSDQHHYLDLLKSCLEFDTIHLLSTSQQYFEIIGTTIHRMELGPLSAPESFAVLQKLNLDLRESTLLKIAEKTGGVPLLLEIIGSQLQTGVLEEEEIYLHLDRMPILSIANRTDDINQNYFNMLKTVFTLLPPNQQDAFVALSAITKSFNQDSANVVVTISQNKTVNLSTLVNYKLLKKFKTATGDRRFEMHPVIREFSMLVAHQNPWWFIRYQASALIFYDYYNYHQFTLDRFWAQVKNTAYNHWEKITFADILSKQFSEAYDSFQFYGDDENIALINYFIGILYHNEKQVGKAKNAIFRSLDIYHKLDSRALDMMGMAKSNSDLGSKWSLQSEWGYNQCHSLITAKNSLSVFGDCSNIAQAFAMELFHQAHIYKTSSEPRPSLPIYDEQWSNFTSSLKHNLVVPEFEQRFPFTTLSMGMTLYGHGYHMESITVLYKALDFVRHDPYDSGLVKIYIGLAHFRMHDISKASDSLYEAVKTLSLTEAFQHIFENKLVISQRMTEDDKFDCMLTSNAAIFVAMLLESKQSYQKSVEMLEIAYAIDNYLLGHHVKTSITLSHIANLHAKLGNHEKALDYQLRTNDARRKIGKAGSFYLQLPDKNSSTPFQDTFCKTMTHWHNTPTREENIQLSYRIQQTILDGNKNNKVWDNEFEILSDPTVQNSKSQAISPTWLAVGLGTEHGNMYNSSDTQINAFNCHLNDADIVNQFQLSHEKFDFVAEPIYQERDFQFSKHLDEVLEHISNFQCFDDDVSRSIKMFLLGHLYMEHSKHQSALELHMQAFQILIESGTITPQKDKKQVKAGPETLQEYTISSILLFGTHPEITISNKFLTIAMKHHVALGNKLEVSQILIKFAEMCFKQNKIDEAIRLFKQAKATHDNYWKLSSYHNMFLSPNELLKLKARQIYKMFEIALGLEFEREALHLCNMAYQTSTTAIYIRNCEPLHYQYTLFALFKK